MAFLFEILKWVMAITMVCFGISAIYILLIIAREVGWMIQQENRKQYKAKQKEGDGK